jgi:hypothetical protein
VALAASGLRVAIDPLTGELVPAGPRDPGMTAAERASALSGLAVQTRADGSRFVLLGGRFRSYSVLRLAEDGRWVEACVHSPAEALARIGLAAAPAAAGEEK